METKIKIPSLHYVLGYIIEYFLKLANKGEEKHKTSATTLFNYLKRGNLTMKSDERKKIHTDIRNCFNKITDQAWIDDMIQKCKMEDSSF